MAIQTQNSKLNVVPGGIIPVVNVSQHDVGRTLTFTLMDGNGAASLASGTTATIEGQKPSGKGFAYAAAINGNVVTINTVFQMTVEAGTVECKIRLKNGNQDVGTALFLMEVEKTGVTDGVDVSETALPVYMEAGRQYMLGAEAWAKGTKNGVAVGSGEPQYHNNAKYWSDQSASSAGVAGISAASAESSSLAATSSALQAKLWATYSDDPLSGGTDTNNAHYWCDQAYEKYNDMMEEIGTVLNQIAAIEALLQLLFGSVYLNTESGDVLTTQSGDRLIISY